VRRPTQAAFAFIFVTVAIDMLGFGMAAPVLPRLVVQLSGGNTAAGAAALGLFGTAWALMQFVFSPVLGGLSDRFGRRRVILISAFGLGLDYVFMALAPNLGFLFVGRVISGITSASFATAGAYIEDVTEPDRRAAQFGKLGVAFGIGFILGPAIGGLLGGLSLRAPFWFAAGLCFLNFAYGLFVLPESLPPERRAPFRIRTANPIGALSFLRARSGLLALSVAAFLSYIAHDSVPNTFVLYTDYRYGWDTRTVGLSLMLAGASSIVVQGLVVGRAVEGLGEWRAMATGMVIGMTGLAVFALAPIGLLFALGIPLWALFGLTNPSLQSLMSRRVDQLEQGRLQGALASLRGIASLVAPLLFTGAFAAPVGSFRHLGMPGAPFLLGVLLLAASLAAATRVRPLNTVPAPATP
jgi:MFS transporter, DHA1 family, tetracycline resistance protein